MSEFRKRKFFYEVLFPNLIGMIPKKTRVRSRFLVTAQDNIAPCARQTAMLK